MRILIVHNYYQHKGGEDVVFQQEVEALKKVIDVETITFQNNKGIKGLLQFGMYPWNLFAANKVLKKAKACKAEIVHIHNTHYALGPLVFRKLHQAGFKTVQTLHNYRLLDPSATLFVDNRIFLNTINKKFPWESIHAKSLDNSWAKTFWTAFAYYLHLKLGTWKMVDKYLVFSNFMKNLILDSSKQITPKQIALKANSIPRPAQQAIAKENNFVYIGRLSIEKGIHVLLEAFRVRPAYRLEIYGDGPLREEVEQAAKSCPNIKYKGFQQKEVLNNALARAQALIVPSIWFEGMPMTILEAYSMGTPVIGSRIGAIAEMVEEGKTGFQFEANKALDLAKQLDNFTRLEDLEKINLQQNCLALYKNQYNIEDNIQRLTNIYQDIITENHE